MYICGSGIFFFFSSRRRHTRLTCDWSSDVCSSDLGAFPPEQVADILSDVLGSSNSSMWEKLVGIPEDVFAGYLLKEHPQTAAFILSKVSASFAARIASQLPRDFRNQLMRRMLALEPVEESALRSVEGVL